MIIYLMEKIILFSCLLFIKICSTLQKFNVFLILSLLKIIITTKNLLKIL